MANSVLFLFWHGLGDLVMAIPAIKEYRLRNPNTRVGFVTLSKIGSAAEEIIGPYVDQIFPVASEPWEWPERYKSTLEEGRKVAMEEAKEVAKFNDYTKVVEITTNPNLHIHKVRRVAKEMGVYPLVNNRPTLEIPEEYVEFGKNYVDGLIRPIWFFHWTARNSKKTLKWRTINNLIATYSEKRSFFRVVLQA